MCSVAHENMIIGPIKLRASIFWLCQELTVRIQLYDVIVDSYVQAMCYDMIGCNHVAWFVVPLKLVAKEMLYASSTVKLTALLSFIVGAVSVCVYYHSPRLQMPPFIAMSVGPRRTLLIF